MQRVLLSCAALALLGSPAIAGISEGDPDVPNQNATRLKVVSNHNNYNDIWGYVAPDGREFALIGARSGLAFIETTEPLFAYEVKYSTDGYLCTWRDIKTYQNYVYEGNDCRPGVRVFDMTDPDDPTEVSWFGTSDFNNSHNIQIDVERGMLYAVGTGSGTYIYDLNVDPVNPPLVTVWNGFAASGATGGYEHDDAGGSGYVHDIHVRDGFAHAARIYAGEYTIADMRNLPAIDVLASVTTGQQFAHSTWTNEDQTIAVVCDEKAGAKHSRIYDISDPTDPQMLANFSEEPISVPHNPFIKGDQIHYSWYTEGYICVDISDPSNPVRVARYDTTPNIPSGGTTGFKGAWGCYPFQPSGFIYISDRANGLYIIRNNTDCLPPGGNAPMVCSIWPNDDHEALSAPMERMIVNGNYFSNITSVTVGGKEAFFNVKDDQVVVVYLPLVDNTGTHDLVITTPSGTAMVQVDVVLPAGPVLNVDIGTGSVIADEIFEIGMGSQPGDLHYAVLGFTEIPSILPGKVEFGIGNAFTDLIFLPVTAANAAGVSVMPMILPAAGVGVTTYWQMAAITPGNAFPAPVSNVDDIQIVLE